jgi:hypothetical protein
MRFICYFLMFIQVLSDFLYAYPLTLNDTAQCWNLANNIKADTTKQYNTDIIDISARYEVIKKFSGGVGGAHVFLVKDRLSEEEKVLKVFPSLSYSSNTYSYREIFYTCLNSFISYEELGYIFTSETKVFGPFPKLYEFGITNKSDLLDSNEIAKDFLYPYIVIELIKGKSLSSYAEMAKNKTANSSYNLYTKDDKSFSVKDKYKSQLIIYQIAQIMYKIKRLFVNGTEYNFVHADLNPGNVMVREESFSGSFDAGFGKIAVDKVPLIAFIDFGHSYSSFDDELGSAITNFRAFYHKYLNLGTQASYRFYKDLTGSDLAYFARLAVQLSTSNTDMRFFRVMARSIFDSNNYTNKEFMKHLNDCTTRTECVEKIPRL